MPDIFDEVEEDLRADRLKRMLFRYGGVLVTAAICVVIAVGGWQAWTWYQGRQALAMADLYLAAAKTSDAASQAKLADIAAQAGPGYRTLARLRLAGELADAGNLAGANAAWDQVAGDGGADRLLRDLANLQWSLHNLDRGDPAAVAARLQPLAAPTSPWHGLADEAQALLALRQGQVDAARDTLRLLVQDTAVPQGVRQRAGGLLEQIGAKPEDTKAATSKVGGS